MVLCQSEISHASSQHQLTCVFKCSHFEGPTKRLTESLMTRGPHPLNHINHFFSECEMCYFRLDLALAACKLMNDSDQHHSNNCDFFLWGSVMVLCQSEISHASSQYQLTCVCKCRHFDGPTKGLTESLMTRRPLMSPYSERDVLLQARLSAGSMLSDEPERRAAQQQLRLFLLFTLGGSVMVLCQSEISHASSQYQLTCVCKCWHLEGPTKRLTETLMARGPHPLNHINHFFSEREMCYFRLDLALQACKLMNSSEEQHSSNCVFFFVGFSHGLVSK